MATTFNWIYLGTGPLIDPTERNDRAENAEDLRFQTYGSTSDPLYQHITSATMIDRGGAAGALDMNNRASNDQFSTDIGAGPQIFTFDATAVYNATVTYADGTSANITAVIAQSTTGELFLAPEKDPNPDVAAQEFKPIVSIYLSGVNGDTFSGLGTDRIVTGWDDAIISGTSGDDLIDASYNEPIANGSDRIDNNDGGVGVGPNADSIDAGDGNDTVYAGIGNDTILGGAGDDLLHGEDGDDTIHGDDGNDTILGETGNDLISGDTGNDLLDGGASDDTIDGGDGDDTIFGGSGNDFLYGGLGRDVLDGGGGADFIYGGADQDTIYGSIGATVDGGDTGVDEDVLDLTSFGKAATNIIFDPGNPENGTVEFLDGFGNVIGTMTFTDIEQVVPCFTPGTRILTPMGPVLVEDLRVGDPVITRDNGIQFIRWIGRRDLSLADLIVRPALRPIRLPAGCLGEDMPCRDMLVSPQHRMLVEGARAEILFGEREVLVAALHLVGRKGAEQVLPPAVSYIHILFDQHEIIHSDGCWSESFQPGGAVLDNMADAARSEVLELFPELALNPSCYPPARTALKAHEARVLLAP